jgi:hypothetical protein
MSNSIKDAIPTDIEITQLSFDKTAADQITRLIDAEGEVMNSLGVLANSFDKTAKLRKAYNDNQFEISRNYIQLVQRKSTIFQSRDLQEMKEHIKRNEDSVLAFNDLKVLFQGISDGYKEYYSNLKEYGKAYQRFIKAETDWYNASLDLRKAKDKYDTERMDKLEKGLVKLKADVEKYFIEKNHRSEFVSKSVVRIDQSFQKLKMNIKNIAW